MAAGGKLELAAADVVQRQTLLPEMFEVRSPVVPRTTVGFKLGAAAAGKDCAISISIGCNITGQEWISYRMMFILVSLCHLLLC